MSNVIRDRQGTLSRRSMGDVALVTHAMMHTFPYPNRADSQTPTAPFSIVVSAGKITSLPGS
jgi:hypothetical protein